MTTSPPSLDPGKVLAAAAAKFEAGDGAGAQDDLIALTLRRPDCVKGHAALAQVRWQLGDSTSFARSYEAALAADQKNAALWSSYFDVLMHARLYADVLERLEQARAAVGAQEFLDILEATAATENNEITRADQAFSRFDRQGHGSLQRSYMRHLLRTQRFEEAAKLGEVLVREPDGTAAWPYLATAWRVLGDSRWHWLEGNEDIARIFQIDVNLPALAEVLRNLHTAKQAPYDQTLRNGTQTYGILLDRREPEIMDLRRALEDSVSSYVAQLPPHDPSHPLLREPRGELGFTASWSVRLTSAGYHVNHTHPMGWISSVFYVVVPVSAGTNLNNPAGWLALGQPPVELGLDLAPTRLVQPQPGRLVLFPSTLWHGTLPFQAGERLTVAFDVRSR